MSTLNPQLIEALEQNWQAEKASACTYRTLADRESDPVRERKLGQLADAEERHAGLWRNRLRELGAPHTAANLTAMRIAS